MGIGATFAAVPERVEGGREAVEGDEAEVPDGRRAEEHVDEQPRIAGGPPEHPVAEALVDGGQRQHGDREQEVAQRQVADKQIGHVAFLVHRNVSNRLIGNLALSHFLLSVAVPA